MKTKILILLSVIIAIMFIGTIKVEAYSRVGTAEELANSLGNATYSENIVKLQSDVISETKEIVMDTFGDGIVLDLNGFSISDVYFRVFGDLHVKNGILEGSIMYWGDLIVENATTRNLNGQAESFTTVKGTSTLSGITLGNLIIEKNATLVVDSHDFEFGYHDYNENGHLCTNNGTILIKDADSEFKIESGNNILNNGNIINNGNYINNANTVYEIIIPKLDCCTITSSTMIAVKGEKIELTIEPNEGYVVKSVSAHKSTDKNIVIDMNGNSFIMPDYNVSINVECEIIKNIESVQITGATMPKVGSTPVTNGLKVPESANYKIISAIWGTWSKEIGPLDSFEAINVNNKFEKGKTYALQVILHSLDKYTSFEKAMATINGIECSGLLGYIDSESVCIDKATYYITFDELIENYFLNNTDNQEYIYSNNKPLSFEIKVPFPLIKEITIDGKKLNIEDFRNESVSGETTKIILTDEFVKSISFGAHTIKFVFHNELEAETKFTIMEPIEDKKENNMNDKEANSSTIIEKEDSEIINNPPTGDNIILLKLLLVISAFGLVVTSRVRKNFEK